jgi:hypothetical protein
MGELTDFMMNFKNGNTFKLTFNVVPAVVPSLDGLGVEASVKTADGAIWPLAVTVANDKLSFTVQYNGSTKGWPPSDARLDVRFTRLSDGFAISTNYLEIKVYKSVVQ